MIISITIATSFILHSPKKLGVQIDNIDSQNSIKNLAIKNFNNVTNNYSLAFKDLSQKSTLSVNNKKTISASTIKIYIMIETFNQVKSGEYSSVENDAAIITTNKGSYILCITTSKSGNESLIKAINNIS